VQWKEHPRIDNPMEPLLARRGQEYRDILQALLHCIVQYSTVQYSTVQHRARSCQRGAGRAGVLTSTTTRGPPLRAGSR